MGILETKQEEEQRSAGTHRCAGEEYAMPVSVIHANQHKRTSRLATADWKPGSPAHVAPAFIRRDNELSLGTLGRWNDFGCLELK